MVKEFKNVDDLSPADFEMFVRDLFLASGWNDAVLTETGKEYRHGDGGVDIFAKKGKRRFAIEVKQRNIQTNVDVKALNQLVTGAKLANIKDKILVTNSYFTSEVKIRALRLGVDLVDRDELQNLWVKNHSEIGRDIRPRKYQQQVIDSASEAFNAGKSKLLIEMATGLGKTYTVALLIKKLIQNAEPQPKILFLAHQVEILLQSVVAFKNVLGIGNYSFSACFDGSTPEDTDFVFATFDTLYNQFPNMEKKAFHYIVVDEAHHTPARTYAEVVKYFDPSLLLGLTATPYRSDNKSVLDFFGGKDGHIGKYDIVWALKHRKLAFPKYLVLLNDLDQERIDQLEIGLSVSDIDKKLFLHKKDQEVVKIIEKTVAEQEIQDVKGIVFCRNIQHMKHLLGFFQLGTATLVHSKMTDQERRENIRMFREGEQNYILVCDLFNEGIDIPETNLLVFMRYTGSRTIWLQQLGRGLRKTPNKEYVHVLDFVGSLERLNEVKDLSERVERTRLEKDNIEEKEAKDTESLYHDSSLEVNYSEGAARVLKLIETMKLQLNSREVLIDKIRDYFEQTQSIPAINELEIKLEDVGCDQVATHFGSYFAYLQAAFNTEFDIESMREKLVDFIKNYKNTHHITPSPKAIALSFTENRLYRFSEKDIVFLIPELMRSSPNSDVTHEAVEGTTEAIEGTAQAALETKAETCEIIEKYKTRVYSRNDLKTLTAAERTEIKSRYRFDSIFLNNLKHSRNEK